MSARGCHECDGIYTHQGMCSSLPADSEAGRARDRRLAEAERRKALVPIPLIPPQPPVQPDRIVRPGPPLRDGAKAGDDADDKQHMPPPAIAP